jgi:hypothetical protein
MRLVAFDATQKFQGCDFCDSKDIEADLVDGVKPLAKSA